VEKNESTISYLCARDIFVRSVDPQTRNISDRWTRRLGIRYRESISDGLCGDEPYEDSKNETF